MANNLIRKTFTLMLFIIFIFSIMSQPVSAHAPSKMKLVYDKSTQELEITITHRVDDENVHYIYQINIWKNGDLFITLNYTNQPTKEKFSYEQTIPADEDDVLKVTAYCNFGGDITTILDLAKGTESETESEELWPFHSLPMLLGFLMMIVGISIAKVMKKKDWWFKAHRTLNLIGTVLAIIGLIMAIYMVTEAGGGHFSVPHAILGGITITLLILSPILGFSIMKAGASAAQIRTAHRWVGRIAISMMLIVMITGYSLVGIL